MTAIQAVFVRGHEERSSPKPHTVYRIDVQANVRSWQMWHRYSEFEALNAELTNATGVAPPAPLPPKHHIFSLRSSKTEKIREDRRVALELYLRAILSAHSSAWRETDAFREFLGVPMGRHGLQLHDAAQFTTASWLDEHMELQALLRDVWATINKRNALSDCGDVAGSQRENIAAKRKLAGVLSRIGLLGKGLHELGRAGMNEGELQRRTDMVARMQDDCEKLSKVVTLTRPISSQPSEAASSSNTHFRNRVLDKDRETLLGPSKGKMSKRVFGAPPQETPVTRPLDNDGLVSLQQGQIQRQDGQLFQLTTILQRLKGLGETINTEIKDQTEMIDDLTEEVDRVGYKLTGAKKQLDRLG